MCCRGTLEQVRITDAQLASVGCGGAPLSGGELRSLLRSVGTAPGAPAHRSRVVGSSCQHTSGGTRKPEGVSAHSGEAGAEASLSREEADRADTLSQSTVDSRRTSVRRLCMQRSPLASVSGGTRGMVVRLPGERHGFGRVGKQVSQTGLRPRLACSARGPSGKRAARCSGLCPPASAGGAASGSERIGTLSGAGHPLR